MTRGQDAYRQDGNGQGAGGRRQGEQGIGVRESSAKIGAIGREPAVRGSVIYGYARVSTREQNLDRQLEALAVFGVLPADVFADKASGKDFDRPAYQALVERLAPGDTLVIKSIDRLGRDYAEILSEWARLTKQIGAAVVVLDMPLLDTRERPDNVTGMLISDIVLQLLSYVAQVEREQIRARQAEGIAIARAKGVHLGRPRKKRPRTYMKTRDLYLDGQLTRKEASARLGVSVNTFVRWLKADGVARKAAPAAGR